MKAYISESSKALFVITLFAFSAIFFTGNSAAAQPPPDLDVQQWAGSQTPMVESPYVYTMSVKNVGNQAAKNVKLTASFPLTATSPQQFILGKLSGFPSTCSIIANKLVCNVGELKKNQTRAFSFTYEFQVATIAQAFTATATTTSTNEANPANNSRVLTPTLRYPDNVVSSGTYLVTLCSGTALTSFYECELYPSSQQAFAMELNLGGTITIPGEPLYTGFWDQNSQPLNKTLHFTLNGGSGTEAEFNGFAVSSTCFEGITTFPNGSGYNAAYRVCEQ